MMYDLDSAYDNARAVYDFSDAAGALAVHIARSETSAEAQRVYVATKGREFGTLNYAIMAFTFRAAGSVPAGMDHESLNTYGMRR